MTGCYKRSGKISDPIKHAEFRLYKMGSSPWRCLFSRLVRSRENVYVYFKLTMRCKSLHIWGSTLWNAVLQNEPSLLTI
jgi:hypothetical protein